MKTRKRQQAIRRKPNRNTPIHPQKDIILVSACLFGKRCAYDGKARTNKTLIKKLRDFITLEVCPEVLGGMTVPREMNEIYQGCGNGVLDGKKRVLSISGVDNTKRFISGAQKALHSALKKNVKLAVLKSRSPSCGIDRIYDGTFSGKTIHGPGVTCALLIRNGIAVFSDEDVSSNAVSLRLKKRGVVI